MTERPEAALHKALTLLGLPEDQHAVFSAIQDQIAAWEAEHPGEDAFLSGECSELYAAMGRLAVGFICK